MTWLRQALPAAQQVTLGQLSYSKEHCVYFISWQMWSNATYLIPQHQCRLRYVILPYVANAKTQVIVVCVLCVNLSAAIPWCYIQVFRVQNSQVQQVLSRIAKELWEVYNKVIKIGLSHIYTGWTHKSYAMSESKKPIFTSKCKASNSLHQNKYAWFLSSFSWVKSRQQNNR